MKQKESTVTSGAGFCQHYSGTDFQSMNFHDCHVYGIKWCSGAFAVTLDVDYILKWVQPAKEGEAFSFWVAEADLTFENVRDLKVDLEWEASLLRCRIFEIRREAAGEAPTGQGIWSFDILLSDPAGKISILATDFRLQLRGDPKLVPTQSVRL